MNMRPRMPNSPRRSVVTIEARGGRVSLYAINAVLERVDPMLREIPGVIASDDAEHLHRMRVASRRLRMALRLLGSHAGLPNAKAFFKLARAVTRALGEARDLDVQIGWLGEFEASCAPRELPGVRRAALRLNQRRGALQPKIVRVVSNLAESLLFTDTVRRLREERLNAEMSGQPDPLRDLGHATRVICLQLDAAILQAAALSSPEAVAGHHQFRIEIKRLRYAMEILGGLYGGALDEYAALTKKLQTTLGELHDADVWIETMPPFIERERKRTTRYYGSARPLARLLGGFEAIAADRREYRELQYGRAKKLWDETLAEGRWGTLRDLILSGYRERAAGPDC